MHDRKKSTHKNLKNTVPFCATQTYNGCKGNNHKNGVTPKKSDGLKILTHIRNNQPSHFQPLMFG
jgi:hypothetical protein